MYLDETDMELGTVDVDESRVNAIVDFAETQVAKLGVETAGKRLILRISREIDAIATKLHPDNKDQLLRDADGVYRSHDVDSQAFADGIATVLNRALEMDGQASLWAQPITPDPEIEAAVRDLEARFAHAKHLIEE